MVESHDQLIKGQSCPAIWTLLCELGNVGGIGLDMVYRYFMYPKHQQSKYLETDYTYHPGYNFIYYHQNQQENKGRWNHNFYCWEKDKDCGRDFDWQQFKKD